MDIVRITELQPKTYVEQGDYIAIDNQSDGTKKVQFTNLLDDTLSQENKIAPANVVGNGIATVRDEVEDEIATIRAAVGSPLKASTVAQMTDTNKIYVYVGSESGYTNGNWYYWNGSAWTSGGVYNSVAVVTDPTLTLSGVPADAKATGDEIGNLKSDFNAINYEDGKIKGYLYKKNYYVNASGVETSLSGYDLYRIPIEDNECLVFRWSDGRKFFNALGANYVFDYVSSGGTYTKIASNGATPYSYFYPIVGIGNNTAFFFNGGGASYISVCVYADYADDIVIEKTPIDTISPKNIPTYKNTAKTVDEIISIKSPFYVPSNGNISALSSPWYVLMLVCKAGDSIVPKQISMTGVSFLGTIVNAQDGSISNIAAGTAKITLTDDATVFLFESTSYVGNYTYMPKDSIMIDSKNVIGTSNNNAFDGLDGVAFGTSITYRAQTTGGYLQYLPDLSGIVFDNEGIGSSSITSNMLTAIKGYSDYADKDVCILEGFVNDWYGNATLGTYEDTTETTVCGCVRSALNYMLSQNANLTVFLILDHYGRNYSGVDCSATAENASGLTQYEYYEEIAKVAESLGIPVIKLYAESQMSQNTPQFFLDNIHPNALGARQTAYAIWASMKLHYPNQTN